MKKTREKTQIRPGFSRFPRKDLKFTGPYWCSVEKQLKVLTSLLVSWSFGKSGFWVSNPKPVVEEDGDWRGWARRRTMKEGGSWERKTAHSKRYHFRFMPQLRRRWELLIYISMWMHSNFKGWKNRSVSISWCGPCSWSAGGCSKVLIDANKPWV